MRCTIVAKFAVLIVNLAAGRDDTTTPDAALCSLTDVAFSPQYTSACWDAERTNQSTLWNEARAYCQSPVHRRAPNCRIVHALVKDTTAAEDEEALALGEQDQRRERQAWEGRGFGGVTRPEPRASASTRRAPAASGRVQASRTYTASRSFAAVIHRHPWRCSRCVDPLSTWSPYGPPRDEAGSLSTLGPHVGASML